MVTVLTGSSSLRRVEMALLTSVGAIAGGCREGDYIRWYTKLESGGQR